MAERVWIEHASTESQIQSAQVVVGGTLDHMVVKPCTGARVMNVCIHVQSRDGELGANPFFIAMKWDLKMLEHWQSRVRWQFP